MYSIYTTFLCIPKNKIKTCNFSSVYPRLGHQYIIYVSRFVFYTGPWFEASSTRVWDPNRIECWVFRWRPGEEYTWTLTLFICTTEKNIQQAITDDHQTHNYCIHQPIINIFVSVCKKQWSNRQVDVIMLNTLL